MTPELQKQLADLIAALMNVASDGATWATTQIPPLVHEKIVYGRIEHSLLGLLFAVVTWRAAVNARGFYQQACADRDGKASRTFSANVWPDRPGGLASIVCAVVGVVSAGLAVSHLDWALMAWLAPRLFIMEWLKDFVGE